MATRQKKNSKLTGLLTPAVVVLALVYFGYHAFHGEHGLMARYRMEGRIAELEMERDAVIAERDRIAHKVASMRLETLDADMLDERARANLNVVHPNEIMILKSSN